MAKLLVKTKFIYITEILCGTLKKMETNHIDVCHFIRLAIAEKYKEKPVI